MRKYTMLLLASMVVCGCQGKKKECNQMIGIINPIMSQFKDFADLNPQNIEQAQKALKTIISLTEKCNSDLGAVAFKTSELRSYVDRYKTMCAEVAAASQEMVEHLESQNKMQPVVLELQKDLQAAGTKLEKACNEAEDASPCKAIAEKLQQMPEDPVAQIVTLKKLVGELKAMEIEDTAIKAAVAEIVVVQERKLELVEQTAELEKKMEATEKKLDAATADEEDLVSGLNSFCQS